MFGVALNNQSQSVLF